MLELFSISITKHRLSKIGRLRKCRLPKSMCNPKDNLVRMIRTLCVIGTIRKCVVSVLEVEVKLKLLNNIGSLLRKGIRFTFSCSKVVSIYAGNAISHAVDFNNF